MLPVNLKEHPGVKRQDEKSNRKMFCRLLKFFTKLWNIFYDFEKPHFVYISQNKMLIQMLTE